MSRLLPRFPLRFASKLAPTVFRNARCALRRSELAREPNGKPPFAGTTGPCKNARSALAFTVFQRNTRVPLKLRFSEGIFRPKRKTGCPGQDFLVPFVAFDKRDSPEGRNKKSPNTPKRRETPSPARASVRDSMGIASLHPSYESGSEAAAE